MPSSQAMQPAQQSQVASKEQQQKSRGQPASFLVLDDQQTGPSSRPLTFTLIPTKNFNPPSVVSVTGEESQQNISGLSGFFRNLQSVMSYQLIDTLQPFSPVDTLAPAASPPTTTASQQEHQQPGRHLLRSQPTQNSNRSRTSTKLSIGPFQDHCC